MISPSSHPLTRPIVARYFAAGLACMAVLTAVITFRASIPEHPAVLLITAFVPLAILWFGSMSVRRELIVPERILQQLTAAGSSSDNDLLQPLLYEDSAAQAWNGLLRRSRHGDLLKSVDSRLGRTVTERTTGATGRILNALGDGIAVSGPDGVIEYANNALVGLLSVGTADELTGRRLTDVLRQRFADCDLLRGSPEQIIAARRFDLKKGQEIHEGVCRITCVPLEDENTAVSGDILWTVRDVTQQLLAEAMRVQFVQTATHELRTPLANIRAYAETISLADDIPVEQQKEFVNVISAEASRLSRFVDELLNLSQMDSGSLTVERHETDIERLLQESIEHTRPQMQQKSICFESEMPAKLPKLMLDKDKIASCLVNLLGNAAKYTPDGGVVRLIVREAASELTVTVEDTGIGIAEEELGRVCDRFFRSNDERVRNEQGSGLGLAYTNEVARLHGGRLTAESRINQGSRFTLSLPL